MTTVRTLAMATLALLASDIAPADDNDDLETQIAALIGVHNAALPISFIPDPVFGIPASAVTFGTNLGLKDTRAIFLTPGDWADSPNSFDGCHYNSSLPQSTASYNNLLGFITLDNVPGQWGELTRTGQVQVVHANTSVNVHANNPFILPDRFDSQVVAFPAGRHQINWRAETQISEAFDIIIPAGLLLYNSIKYGAALANSGASAASQKASQNVARGTLQNIAQQTGLVTAAQFFEGRTSVVHERQQEITIYKTQPPQISTNQPLITLEATDFGGVLYQRVANDLRQTINASDPCGLPFTLGNDAGALLGVGTTALTWTISDSGPLPGGGGNSSSIVQQIVIEDTQAPLLLAPPGRVIEIPMAASGLNANTVMLGAARAVDLADPDPVISNNGPAFYPINSRSSITWTATDAAGNSNADNQLITIKSAGTNSAPGANNVAVSTLTSQAVDLVLSAQDPDFLDGRFDPLSFRISERPDQGEFVAPLYPFFIEDFRTSPGGPYGEAFYLSNNRSSWMYANVCQTGSGPNADRIQVDWVYEPEFIVVDDKGMVFIQDRYWQCSSSSASAFPRISSWDRDGNFIGQIAYEGANDAFVLDRDGFIYEFKRVGSGSSREIFINRCATDFVGKANRPAFCDSLGSVDSSSAPNLQPNSVSYARVDSSQGLLYVTDKSRVFAFDIRNNPPDPIYLATLNETPFPTPSPSCAGSSLLGYAMDVDSTGALYMSNCANERIEKFSASTFDEQGQFMAGEYIGWMGRCQTSTNNACDDAKQISKGFSCTDATCSRSTLAGAEPGQFDTPLYVAIDPNDVLYVAEWDNFRVQRFAPDGTFAGQALSTGSGINQGEQPGFVLGNMGRPRAVSVNSSQFYVVDREEGFVHVFETSPLKDITDNSVTVSYVSNFNFQGEDSFRFVASDGLADSDTATASITVSRNFRAPVALDQSVSTMEDQSVDITLSADDLDGITGFDLNGLDTLSFSIVKPPENGSLAFVENNAATRTLRYQPFADFVGEDRFTFIANDGVDDSEPGTVDIEITYVDDPPRILSGELPPRVGLGFPFVFRGRFSDDGADGLFTSIDWGDGTTDVVGGVDDDPNNPRIEGILEILPPQGRGEGFAIAQHSFTVPGPRDVEFCISDTLPREVCLISTVTPEPLVSLGIELPEDQGETSPPDLLAGESFTIDVVVGNLEPAGATGLIAQAIAMQGSITAPGVFFTGSSEGSCAISPDRQSISCDFGDFAVGEQRLITLGFATGQALVEDALANIRLSFTTSSEAVNEITEVYLTRNIISVIRVFNDGFEPE